MHESKAIATPSQPPKQRPIMFLMFGFAVRFSWFFRFLDFPLAREMTLRSLGAIGEMPPALSRLASSRFPTG